MRSCYSNGFSENLKAYSDVVLVVFENNNYIFWSVSLGPCLQREGRCLQYVRVLFWKLLAVVINDDDRGILSQFHLFLLLLLKYMVLITME